MRPLIPLHVHGHYSLLEGVDGIDAILERGIALGYPALAITDTNNLYGVATFVERAQRRGVRPIVGSCLRHGGRRCTALVAEPEGYASLCRILSRLHLQKQPHLHDLLRENHQGLHVLVDDAADLEALHGVFGSRLWLEIIRPGPINRERQLLEAGARRGVKPVASMAAHFATPAGYDVFRLLTAVRNGTLLQRLPANLGVTPEHYLLEAETAHRRFRDLPEAIVNAERLANQCRSDVLPRGFVLPPPRLPPGAGAASHLRELCEHGLSERYSRPMPATSNDAGESPRERLERELHVVNLRDLAGYFLVVHDIASEARRRKLTMALRGSAGNSLICYLLGITDVDPLRFDLPMERFLHAGRPDLPDIDLDFDWKVRDEIIQAVFAKYGEPHVAMISSHLFLQPRSAFREAAKVHGLSNEQVSRLLEGLGERVEGLVAGSPSPPTLLPHGERGAHGRTPRSFPLEPERWPRLLADAARLLGRPHHLSIHPGGIVITPKPIENYVPLQRAAKGIVITQLDKDGAEAIGLVKIDLLGNRALATVDEAKRVLANGANADRPAVGLKPNGSMSQPLGGRAIFTSRPVGDRLETEGVGGLGEEEKVLDLLRRGDTLGVNQLESPAMRHLLVQMQPRGLNDVIQSLALIRPGAATVGAKERFIRRRRGIEPIVYDHPSLAPLLGETCGLMVYEDDALRVVQALTGFDAIEADRFRKRVTKRTSDDEAMALSRTFLDACERNGVSREAAGNVWVQLAKFNNYSFCKSHAVSYGLIAWEAVRLKVTAPLCFWVAALNNNQGMYPRRVYVEAVKQAGIQFHLPCVNQSTQAFRRDGDGIRVGLGAIHGLDDATQEALIAERERHGPFASLAECRRRVNLPPEALAMLIQAGAFDFTGKSRPALALEAELDRVGMARPALVRKGQGKAPRTQRLSPGEKVKAEHVSGQSDLFAPDFFAWSDWTPADSTVLERWREEWELLGFLVGPPVMSLFRATVPAGLDDSRSLASRVGRRVRIAGLVATARQVTTNQGKPMQFVTLQDEWGLVEATLFPDTCPLVPYLRLGPYVAEGVVEEQHGVLTVTARRFTLATH